MRRRSRVRPIPALLLGCAALFAGGLATFGGCGDDATGTTSTTGDEHPFCGNGMVETDQGEECDDGNQDDSDGCLPDCTIARCSDGHIESGIEECDDGNDVETDDCLGTCVRAECGDGFVRKTVEACDDGNEEDGDACSNLCQPGNGCGNGVVETGEECDDANVLDDDDCVTGCKNAKCGDGFGRRKMEQCDDGDTDDTNACSNSCKLNPIAEPGCPGTAVTLQPNLPVTLGAIDKANGAGQAGSCGGNGSELVYAFTAGDDGVVRVKMEALDDTTDPVLYARTDCANPGSEIDCRNRSGPGGRESLEFEVETGKTYFVLADSASADASGPFFLTAELSGAALGDDCPGVHVPIDVNQSRTFQGNTIAATANRVGTGLCNSPHSKDVVYEVVPSTDGTILATLMPSYDASLYLRSSCTDPTSQLLCSEMGGSGMVETLTQDVNAGVPYYFVVDGFNGDAGPYSIEFTLAPL